MKLNSSKRTLRKKKKKKRKEELLFRKFPLFILKKGTKKYQKYLHI